MRFCLGQAMQIEAGIDRLAAPRDPLLKTPAERRKRRRLLRPAAPPAARRGREGAVSPPALSPADGGGVPARDAAA